MFLRRLGQVEGNQCEGGFYCPQILENIDHDFTAVGPVITDEAAKAMPPGPGIGPKEGAVRIPRAVMLGAMIDLIRTA